MRNTGEITVAGASARGMQAVTFGAGAIDIEVIGGSVTASHDADDDTLDGTGLYASTGGAGSIDADIRGGALITAPQAVQFEGGPAVLALTDSRLNGRVGFGGGADSVSRSTMPSWSAISTWEAATTRW